MKPGPLRANRAITLGDMSEGQLRQERALKEELKQPVFERVPAACVYTASLFIPEEGLLSWKSAVANKAGLHFLPIEERQVNSVNYPGLLPAVSTLTSVNEPKVVYYCDDIMLPDPVTERGPLKRVSKEERFLWDILLHLVHERNVCSWYRAYPGVEPEIIVNLAGDLVERQREAQEAQEADAVAERNVPASSFTRGETDE